MEFKEIISKRRSVRKFSDHVVPQEVIDRLLDCALLSPSSKNSRSTRFLVVTNRAAIERMADMRDSGARFIKNASLVILLLGDPEVNLWRENAAIAATVLQLACVDEGLSSCWVQINDRPRVKECPEGEKAIDFLRTFLPIPTDCEVLCAIATGYSDFTPAALPPFERAEKIICMK
ncbi:MAG: nitroreductase family protein [Alistipes sp.]